MEALGASATILEISDAYSALDKGVVDGFAAAWGVMSSARLNEVTKYHTLLGICPSATHFMANRAVVWDKLTPEQQQVMKSLEPVIQSMIAKGNVLSSMSARFQEASAEKGHEMITWSDEDMKAMREKFRPIWDRWAENMESKGLPGKQILQDAIDLIDAYNLG